MKKMESDKILKLNILTTKTTSSTHTNVHNHTINLKTDFSESEISLDKFSNWNVQNFTELLNQPKKSFFNELTSRFSDSHTHFDLNLDKFSELDSPCSKSKLPSKPLKVLLQEDFTNYLKGLRSGYSDFKFNHYSKYYVKIKHSNKNVTMSSNPSYYPSQKLIQLKLTKDFLLPEGKFRIDKAILEKKRDELELIVMDHIEKGGKIEMEVEAILKSSGCLYNYIENNLSLESQVDFFLNRIKRFKENKEKFRKYLIMNTNKLVIRGSKKKHVEMIINYSKGLKELKEIIDKIHKTGKNNASEITKSSSSLQEENELFFRGKELIKKLKSEMKTKVVNQIEIELLNYNNKSSEKMTEEFSKIFVEMFKSTMRFELESNYANLGIDIGLVGITSKFKFDSLAINEPNFAKLKEILNAALKKDSPLSDEALLITITTGPLSKLKKCFLDIFSYTKETLISSVNAINANPNNFLRDKLLITLLIKIYVTIDNNFEFFKREVLNTYFTNTEHFNNFYSDLLKLLKTEMNKSIQFFLDSSLNNSVNESDIDQFYKNYMEMTSLCQPYCQHFSIDSSVLFSKYENEFVFQFFETRDEKMREFLEKEDWNPLQMIPVNFQNIVDFLITTNFIELKMNDKKGLIGLLNKEELNIQSGIVNNEATLATANNRSSNENNKIFIEIFESNFKVTNSTLETVSFIFETVKIISFFDISLSETVVYQFVKILKVLTQLSKEIIIEGEGVKKGKLKSISQKEISLLCAKICILENIILQVIKSFSSPLLDSKQEIIIPTLNEILVLFKKLRVNCKDKINELFTYTIGSSIEELSKLGFSKYPVLDKKEHNLYCIKFKSFKTLYNHMLNAFEKEELISIFKDNLGVYFERLEKSMMNIAMANASKIESEASLKQLKSDLLFLKKTLKTFEIVDTICYREKVDQIMSMMLPPKLLKRKKLITQDSSKNVQTEEF